jgi:hypothetical protein
MWERGARHNPASLRYRFYMDHRPFLPQDPTLGFLRTAEGSYESFYLPFKLTSDQLKYILINNIPVRDREELKNIMSFDNKLRSNFKYFFFVATIFAGTPVLRLCNFKKFYHKALALGATYFCISKPLNGLYTLYYNDIMSYYYYKYQNIATDNINETIDKRREFYRLDTSTYYRETSQDIRHNSHHPANSGHHDHDTSTYYGPYPVSFFFFFPLKF